MVSVAAGRPQIARPSNLERLDMTLSPEEIAHWEFAIARRGYDKDEVDAFLSQVAAAYQGALSDKAPASSPSFESLGQEVSGVLRVAKETADEINRKSRQEAEKVRTDANEKAKEIRRKAEQEANAQRDRTSKEGEKTVREAELRAERLENATKNECRKLLDEAVSHHENLTRHERELRDRVEAVEVTLKSLRLELNPPDAAPGQDMAETSPIDLTDSELAKKVWSDDAGEVSGTRVVRD